MFNDSFTAVNAYPNRKLISYSFKEQITDIFPALMMTMAMTIIVYFLGYIAIPELPKMFLQIVGGAVSYIFMSIIFHNKELEYILGMINMKLKRHTE